LPEKILSRRRYSRDIIQVPFNGGVDIFENLFDRVCDFTADTVSRNQGNLSMLRVGNDGIRWKQRTVWTPPYFVEGYENGK